MHDITMETIAPVKMSDQSKRSNDDDEGAGNGVAA